MYNQIIDAVDKWGRTLRVTGKAFRGKRRASSETRSPDEDEAIRVATDVVRILCSLRTPDRARTRTISTCRLDDIELIHGSNHFTDEQHSLSCVCVVFNGRTVLDMQWGPEHVWVRGYAAGCWSEQLYELAAKLPPITDQGLLVGGVQHG